MVSPVSLRRGKLPCEVWPCPSLYWDLLSSDVMLPPGPGRWWYQGSPQVQVLQRTEASGCNTNSDLEQADLQLAQDGPGAATGPAKVQIPVWVPASHRAGESGSLSVGDAQCGREWL